jgi:hypothetical protein
VLEFCYQVKHKSVKDRRERSKAGGKRVKMR